MTTFQEGKARIEIEEYKISRAMPVFYNPVMKLNRDLTVLLLNAIEKKNMRISDPLAATGIRSIRLLLELDKDKIQEIHINDNSAKAWEMIKSNLSLNGLADDERAKISCKDANESMLSSKGFDYIDIDPFGSPNPFLDSAIKRLSRDGILAVTATDTAPLCDTFPEACKRKYWAVPMRNELMHEVGLRILIRKVQLVAAQYDKALVPILSYAKEHYFRAFFRCTKSKQKVDEIIAQHNNLYYCAKCLNRKIGNDQHSCCDRPMAHAGPLWTGLLHDAKLAAEISKQGNQPFTMLLNAEAKFWCVGFYDIDAISSHYKLKPLKKNQIVANLQFSGLDAASSHFGGIVTKAGIDDVVKAMKR